MQKKKDYVSYTLAARCANCIKLSHKRPENDYNLRMICYIRNNFNNDAAIFNTILRSFNSHGFEEFVIRTEMKRVIF